MQGAGKTCLVYEHCQHSVSRDAGVIDVVPFWTVLSTSNVKSGVQSSALLTTSPRIPCRVIRRYGLRNRKHRHSDGRGGIRPRAREHPLLHYPGQCGFPGLGDAF